MADKPKFTEFFPRKFTGEKGQCPDAHIVTFIRYAKAHKLLDKDEAMVSASNDKVVELEDTFFRTLGDKALMWFDSVCGSFTGWKDIKTAFLHHFSGSVGISGDYNAFNIAQLEPGESMREYRYRLTGLASRLGLPDPVIKDRFVNGLPDHIKLQLLPFYGKPLEELFEMAQNMAGVARIQKPVAAANVAQYDDLNDKLSKLTDLVTQMGSQKSVPSQQLPQSENLEHTPTVPQLSYISQPIYSEYEHYDPYSDYLGSYDPYLEGRMEGEAYEGFYSSHPSLSGRGRGRGGHGSFPSRGRGRPQFTPAVAMSRPVGPHHPPGPQGPGHYSSVLGPASSFGGTRGRGTYRGGFYYSSPVCHFCKIPGHIWSKCSLLGRKIANGEICVPSKTQDFQ